MPPSLPLRAACLLAALSSAARAQVDWQGPDDGDWSNPANWNSGFVPGFPHFARIGGSFGIENDTVVLDQPGFVSTLLVQDGMTLSNRVPGVGTASPLTVAGMAILSGENEGDGFTYHSTLGLYRSPALYDLSTDVLNLVEGSRLDLHFGAIANVHNALVIHGPDNGYGEARVHGYGVVNLTGNGSGFIGGGTTLVNNGAIDPQGALTFNQTGGGLYNLDGNSGDTGRVLVSGVGFAAYDNLTLNGTGLTDAFSGEILLRTGRSIDMNLSDGWAIDAGGEVRVQIDGPALGLAYIAGGDLEFGGTLQLDDHQFDHSARLLIESDTTITPTANVGLGSEAILRFEETRINGGQFNLSEDALIMFHGDTVVAGGEFTTVNDSFDDGYVGFVDTTYRGNVTFNGIAVQFGDATVDQISVINADRFVMTANPGVDWNVNSLLTINAENLAVFDNNTVTGDIHVAGNALSRLSINLADPNAEWQLDGAMTLNNNLPFGATRLGGSAVRFVNQLNLEDAGIGIDADATFALTSTVTFADADSSVIMRQSTRVEEGATFIGDGLLRNGTTGHMTLDDGVGTDDVGLRNDGLLDIDDGAGIVTVDRFENTADGTLAIDVGGHLLGDEFDHLHVAGETMIDGILAVDLLLDEFAFLPEIGDEFMILTSLGGVSGQFAEVLPTLAGDQVFGWEVLYHPHDVTIRLASVEVAVPEPTGLALLGLTSTLAFLRRR